MSCLCFNVCHLQPVWPDLATFCNLGKFSKIFGKLLMEYLVFGKLLNQLWRTAESSNIIQNNLAILSHCLQLAFTKFSSVFRSNYIFFYRYFYPIISFPVSLFLSSYKSFHPAISFSISISIKLYLFLSLSFYPAIYISISLSVR